MKRARRILLVVASCGVAVAIAGLVWPGAKEEQGPYYAGQSLRTWLSRYREVTGVTGYSPLGSEGSVLKFDRARFRLGERVWITAEEKHPEAKEAADAIRQIGTNGLPFLLKWIRYEKSGWRGRVERFTASLDDPDGDSFISEKLPTDRKELLAADATIGLQVLGAQASAALPELKQLAWDGKNEPASRRAQMCLPYLGRDALREFVTMLGDAGLPLRTRLEAGYNAGLMGYLGTNVAPLVRSLVSCLEDTPSQVSQSAAQALGMYGLEPEICVPALGKCLRSPDGDLRRVAAYSLLRFGNAAHPLVEEVCKVAVRDSDDPFVRARLAKWLRKYAPEVLESQ